MFEFYVPNRLSDYNRFKIYDSMRHEPARVWIMPLFMAIFAGITVIAGSWAFAAVCLVLGAVFPLITYLMARTSGKSLLKERPDYEKGGTNYRIERTHFYVWQKDENPLPIKYTDLYCAVQTKDSFYLYDTKETCFIISKEFMKEQDAVIFGRILEINLQSYRKYSNKS